MKKIAILNLLLLFFIGCNNEQAKVQQNTAVTQNSNASQLPSSANDLTVSSHSQDKKPEQMPNVSNQNSGEKTKWTQSGNPIDTAEFDTEIKNVQEKMKANPKEESLKKVLAEAYVRRGMALTDARQYASALGDYRKAQKLDPANELSKEWIGQIIGIYDGLNKDYPKEGQEPPPLPFK
jgi:tetratricopeptide (TPR) repeat protein